MRTLLLKIHLVLAIVAGVFIVIMGLSGSVLVFRADLERAFLPAVTAPAALASAAPVPLGQVIRQFQTAHPGTTIRSITLPAPGTNDALLLAVNESKGGAARVYLNPASGRELGRRTTNSDWLSWLVNLHHTLFTGGHFVTGLVGAAFSIMCSTGIIVWWPGRRSLSRSPAFQPRRVARFGARELHHLTGFWAFIVLFVLAFTSTVFTWRDAYNTLATVISGTNRPPLRVQITGNATTADLGDALAAAHAAVPAGVPTSIRPAGRPGEPIVVRMKVDGELRKIGATQVFVDADTHVVKIDRLADAPLPYRIVEAFTPVHFAEVGGLPVKIVWALAGLVPAILFGSGFRIWWRSLNLQRAGAARISSSSANVPVVAETLD